MQLSHYREFIGVNEVSTWAPDRFPGVPACGILCQLAAHNSHGGCVSDDATYRVVR